LTELDRVVNDFFITAADGKSYNTKHYNIIKCNFPISKGYFMHNIRYMRKFDGFITNDTVLPPSVGELSRSHITYQCQAGT